MKPIFTIHAGEYLVGEFLEQHLSKRVPGGIDVWIPAKDRGVDLLVTDKTRQKSVGLQVKFSKDFSFAGNGFSKGANTLSIGFWNFNMEKLRKSTADFWVIVMHSYRDHQGSTNARTSTGARYLVIEPNELFRRLESIHPQGGSTLKSYFTVINVHGKEVCLETRDFGKQENSASYLSGGILMNADRNMSPFLNCWNPVVNRLI